MKSILILLPFAIVFCIIPAALCDEPPSYVATMPPVDQPVPAASAPVNQPAAPPSATALDPAALHYLGAFRLPQGGERPQAFAYGGAAMTFNPQGDPSGAADGFPGSLFIMGHDRLPYGEMPDGNQVAEINIPIPLPHPGPDGLAALESLNTAGFIQPFQDVARGFFTRLDEIPRAGMQYLDHPQTGPKIHLAWGQHLPPDPPAPSHAWFNPNLAEPQTQGEWYIAGQSQISVNGYIIEIPGAWADANTEGRPLATGRFKDGGWSGMGPELFAYRPWNADGSPPPSGSSLPVTTLLQYPSSEETDQFDRALNNYQHPDEWEGGAWITTSAGSSAVLFAGTKSVGEKYWYGFKNPAGVNIPCIESEMIGQFVLCRLADGSPCPPADMTGCASHDDYRGWWSTRFTAQFILYDPASLASVAAGELEPWQPQPYAVVDIDSYLFNNPAGIETDMLGTDVQRRYRIGEVAFDRANGLLYVLEMFADQAQPVVHVWQIQDK